MDPLQVWLTRFSRLNAVALEERAAARASTASEDAVLGMLLIAGPALNPSKLQALVIQSPGGLTKTLRRLEASGLVRREHDAADRRALLVVLTAKGRRAAERSVAAYDAHYANLLGDLDDEEREELNALLRKILDRLEETTGMVSTHGGLPEASASRR